MSKLSPESKAATKVIAKACTYARHRRALQATPEGQKARQIGRLNKSSDELVEAVDQFEKSGRSGQP